MRTDLTTGQMSYLDPHVGQVEKEPSALLQDLLELRPILEQLEKMVDTTNKMLAISAELRDRPTAHIEEVVTAIDMINDAHYCLNYNLEAAIREAD